RCDNPQKGTHAGGIIFGLKGTTAPSPVVVALKIDGPATIAPGQTVSFAASATLSNGTTADYTRSVEWSAFQKIVLTIAADSGVATGLTPGDVTVQAIYGNGVGCCRASLTSTVLPPNTFRLTGKVLESGLPIQGAAVAVVSGIGAGLSAITDYS